MQNFNLGPIRGWTPIGVGEVLSLDVPSAGYREVKLEVMADRPVSVHVVFGDDYYLAAFGHGLMSLRFVIDEAAGLVVSGEGDADVFIRTHTEPQAVPEDPEAPFVTIEPRRSGPSDEMKRMMHLMRLNEAHRARQHQEQLALFRQQQQVEVIETPASVAVEKALDEKGAKKDDK